MVSQSCLLVKSSQLTNDIDVRLDVKRISVGLNLNLVQTRKDDDFPGSESSTFSMLGHKNWDEFR